MSTAGALTFGGGATYIGPFAATPEQRTIFSQAYQKAAPVTKACFWGAYAAGAAVAGGVGAGAASVGEIAATIQGDYAALYGTGLNFLFRQGSWSRSFATSALIFVDQFGKRVSQAESVCSKAY